MAVSEPSSCVPSLLLDGNDRSVSRVEWTARRKAAPHIPSLAMSSTTLGPPRGRTSSLQRAGLIGRSPLATVSAFPPYPILPCSASLCRCFESISLVHVFSAASRLILSCLISEEFLFSCSNVCGKCDALAWPCIVTSTYTRKRQHLLTGVCILFHVGLMPKHTTMKHQNHAGNSQHTRSWSRRGRQCLATTERERQCDSHESIG